MSFLWILFALGNRAYAQPPLSTTDLPGEVKKIISNRSCAHCHTPGLPTTRKAALQIFDLSRDDSFSQMTSKQLKSFQNRLFTTLSPEEARELGGGVPDPVLTSAEKTTILNFVVGQSARH